MIVIRNNNGELEAAELNFTQGIHLEALVPHFRISERQQFTYDKRTFEYSLFAKREGLIYTINCPLLKWDIPATVKETDLKINSKNSNVTVYMKDVILVTEVDVKSKYNTAYITTKQQQVPHLTNIFASGKVCCDFINESQAPFHPSQIITQLEQAKGNTDLATEKYIKTSIQGGRVIVTPPNQGPCPHHIKPFITEYIA